MAYYKLEKAMAYTRRREADPLEVSPRPGPVLAWAGISPGVFTEIISGALAARRTVWLVRKTSEVWREHTKGISTFDVDKFISSNPLHL